MLLDVFTAHDIKLKVTYVCSGERVYVESRSRQCSAETRGLHTPPGIRMRGIHGVQRPILSRVRDPRVRSRRRTRLSLTVVTDGTKQTCNLAVLAPSKAEGDFRP